LFGKTTQKTTQKKSDVPLNKNQIKVIELIRENSNITIKEMAKHLKITIDGVKYNLNKLIKNNVIERVGPDNGGYWIVK